MCQTKHWGLDYCLGKTADKWHLWYEPSQTCGDTGLLLSSIPWPYRPVLLIPTSQSPCWRPGIVQPLPSSWSYPTTTVVVVRALLEKFVVTKHILQTMTQPCHQFSVTRGTAPCSLADNFPLRLIVSLERLIVSVREWCGISVYVWTRCSL